MTQLLICGEALELARSVEVDMAVLDLNLAGEMSYPAAEVLQARGVPMIFAIGYGSDGLSEMFRGVPAMSKPYNMVQLANALLAAMDVRSRSGPVAACLSYAVDQGQPRPVAVGQWFGTAT